MASDKWELSKENIAPSRSGRSMAALSSALGSSESELGRKKLEVEELLRGYAGPDPLSVYVQAIRDAESWSVTGNGKVVRNVAEKALKRWAEEPGAYRNDPRFLFVWLKFAAYTRSYGSTAVYTQMKEMDNCTALAGFWVQWAAEIEAGGNVEKAAALLREGFDKAAEPRAKLQRAQEELEERAAAAALAAAEDDDDLGVTPEKTRKFMSVLRGVGRHKATPVDRAHGVQEPVMLEGAATAKRGALGAFRVLEEEELLGPAATPSQTHKLRLPHLDQKENSHDPAQWTKAKIGGARKAPVVSGSGSAKFEVFDDAKDDSRRHLSTDSEALKGRTDTTSHPLTSVFKDDEAAPAAKGVNFAWSREAVSGVGGTEMSFEEARAMRPEYTVRRNVHVPMGSPFPKAHLQPEPSAPPAAEKQPEVENVKMPKSALKQPRRGLAEKSTDSAVNSPLAKKAPIPLVPSAHNFTEASFTTNLRRVVDDVFSSTVLRPTEESEDTLMTAPSPDLLPPTPAPSTAPFTIFEDPAPEAPKPAFSVFVDPEPINDENAKPPAAQKKETVFLKPVAPVVRQPLQTAMVPPLVPMPPPPALLAEQLLFDDGEETVANFGNKLASSRLSSTPAHYGAFLPPSFSAAKLGEANDGANPHADNLFGLDPESMKEMADIIGDLEPKKAHTTLYTIQETSRETFRSGSTSDSAHSTRGYLTSVASTPGQALLGAPSFAVTPAMRAPPTPSDDSTASASAPPSKDLRDMQASFNSVSVHEKSDLEVGDTTVMGERNREPVGENEVDPWASQWQTAVLEASDFLKSPLIQSFATLMPAIRANGKAELGNEGWAIGELLGKGAFACAYKATRVSAPTPPLVLKVQKPSCPWELHVCRVLGERLASAGLARTLGPAVMHMEAGLLFADGSVLVNGYEAHGTLLDLGNAAQVAASKQPPSLRGREPALGEYVVAWLALHILRLFRHLHSDDIGLVHGDVKPDNFLVTDLPDFDESPESVLASDGGIRGVRLIDWGRAIDIRGLDDVLPPSFPRPLSFNGAAETDGFVCREMAQGKPWRTQGDVFGILGTLHVLLFGGYMNTFQDSAGAWRCTANFKRSWWGEWKGMYAALLNIPSCAEAPDLGFYIEELEDYIRTGIDVEADEWRRQLKAARAAFRD